MLMKKGVVVGGSISGCAIAILLSRLGFKLTVLERSSGIMKGQGAGIMLPVALVEKCIELDLFDADIPRLPIVGRTFYREASREEFPVKIWDQSLQGFALNWIDVYRNLRKRLKESWIHPHMNVIDIHREDSGYLLKTASQASYTADFVIAADGGESIVRKQWASGTENYAGYIAWRGTLADSSNDMINRIQCYTWADGHLLLYPIPAVDYEKTGKLLINWLIYERTDRDQLPLRLTDSQYVVHSRSVPATLLHETQRQYLHSLAKAHFPKAIADIVVGTAHPFIQVIHDFQMDPYPDDGLLFVGDAAATLRPHSASGVTKALGNAIELHRLLLVNPEMPLSALFKQWKGSQQKNNAEEVDKAKKMGDALVMNPPDWQTMDQDRMDAWWTKLMLGHTWFATQPLNHARETPIKNTPLRAKL
ncbi:hypothetical protein D6J04_13050 [Legionella taurinensis]|uniref:2,6-dihydroxypyridine 3-monooxygenase substrate binding domain-containing protein n=3 Tax=Legionella taurinensis TaxID=70611 RepID=A0A3A5LAB8_9GAMM|nr:FAD-dependent monooxygenase [Legionella taurinensis]RJT44173.1 hypothetical protein D6J04_13050 [Legionella taurinensis]RJT64897.1 hypothetical protein D6J03_13750 [Legionella taurinensis]